MALQVLLALAGVLSVVSIYYWWGRATVSAVKQEKP